jgi:two-component system alkaline phosphatase synthesis response regulator PhoP
MKPENQDSRTKARILCVDDDINLLQSLSFILWKEGYNVFCAQNGREAVELARKEKPDLVLLDLMLPGMTGPKVCGILKKTPATKDILIIMVTAKKEIDDIVTGLRSYADDYITKPFEMSILLARIEALLRRRVSSDDEPANILEIYDLVINRNAYEVLLNGQRIRLSKTEFEILDLLASRPNQVFTRARILDYVREDGYPITERVVDYHITGLRKKLGRAKRYVQTVRGVGYKFNAESG